MFICLDEEMGGGIVWLTLLCFVFFFSPQFQGSLFQSMPLLAEMPYCHDGVQ